MNHFIKKLFLQSADILKADVLFRHLNKNKLLVVMYHGITENSYDPPVWTQLPVEAFKTQLRFLQKNYRIVSLREVTSALLEGTRLPERSALITFDDGLKNNFSVAFPVLREMEIPATVFVTVDFVGSGEFLWVDELYLIIREAASRGIAMDLSDPVASEHFRGGRVWEAYWSMVETLKRVGAEKRTSEMRRLRHILPDGKLLGSDDFGMLDWNEVFAMHRSGLIDFGVHTATHRILSELESDELEEEVIAPRRTLESKLGCDVRAFCFPNGRPRVDFNEGHLNYLRNAGYFCAFTTESSLFSLHTGDCMAIGRMPAGNDETSDPAIFRMNVSGVISSMRNLLFWRH